MDVHGRGRPVTRGGQRTRLPSRPGRQPLTRCVAMVSTLLPPEVAHPDTQAVLLLCGAFARGSGTETRPLTLTEYNALASWLGRHGRRPADLLGASDDLYPVGEPG